MGRGRGAIRTAFKVTAVSVVAIVVVDLGLRLVLDDPRDPSTGFGNLPEAYRDAEWAPQMFDEYYESLRMRWWPYVYWRHVAHVGRYVNVDENGIRATWNPEGDASLRRKVFMLGGSTMWGTGARDDFTIPSHVSRILNESGFPVEVRNLGQSGYVSTQEVIELYRRIQQGDLPDVVVFYDGINDVFSAFQNHRGGLPQNEWRRIGEFNLSHDVTRLASTLIKRAPKGLSYLALRIAALLFESEEQRPLPKARAERVIAQTLYIYASNLGFVERMGESYGFAPRFYLQPILRFKPNRTPYEEEEATRLGRGVNDLVGSAYQAFDRSKELRARSRYRNLSRIFRDRGESIFIDFAHTTEDGNLTIAREIARDVARDLRARMR